MSFVTSALIMGGATLGASYLGSRAAKNAANTQADAANRAADLQRQTFEEQTALQEPFRQGGLTAQNKLMTLLGLGPRPEYGVSQPAQPTVQDKMPEGSGLGDVLARAIWRAQHANDKPASASSNLPPEGSYGDVNSPEFGKYGKAFSETDWKADPGYAFRLGEGLKAIERSAAARGGLLSGRTGKSLERFGQDYGSQEYNNAFNRYYSERANALNPLQSLAGVGQTATNQIGTAAGNYATNAGNLMTSGAAAQAAGQVGAANALTSGLGTYLNYNQGNNLINALNQNRAGYGGVYGSNMMPTVAPSYAGGGDWTMGGTWAP
jgi:hypothetical protein